jgi:hypothetical protein
MRYLRRVSGRHQITIPPSLMAEAGIPDGGLVSIVAEGGRLILEPREVSDKELEREDWDKIEKLVSREEAAGRYTEYPDPASAKKHLKKLRRR